jgi:hypothetical protein
MVLRFSEFPAAEARSCATIRHMSPPAAPSRSDANPSDAPTDPHGLTRQLTLRDLVLAQILNVVGSSWVGVAASFGRAQAMVWISAMLVFYLPMAISVYFLNREMPLEGGLYVWARTAFGDLAGFMTAWNIWAYGLCVAAAILDAIPTELAYLIGPSAAWLPGSHWASAIILGAVVAALTVASLRGLSLGRWIHSASGAAMLSVFLLLILTPFWSLAHRVPLHYAPLAIALPHADPRSLAFMGQMFGALCGLEYIAILAGEAKSPTRNIGRSVVIASPIICAMFILGTGSVLAFHQLHPATSIDFIAPIPQTLRFAFGNHGGGNLLATLAIVFVQVRLLGATSLIFTGVTRLPMTAGWDQSGSPPTPSSSARPWLHSCCFSATSESKPRKPFRCWPTPPPNSTPSRTSLCSPFRSPAPNFFAAACPRGWPSAPPSVSPSPCSPLPSPPTPSSTWSMPAPTRPRSSEPPCSPTLSALASTSLAERATYLARKPCPDSGVLMGRLWGGGKSLKRGLFPRTK